MTSRSVKTRKIGPPRPPAKPFVIPHIPGPPRPGATTAHASPAAAHTAPSHATAAHHGKWDEEKHPRDHGKFSHTPGAKGEQEKPEQSIADRARASLTDPAFAREHSARLQDAADVARSAFPHELRASDHATPAAQEAIQREAERIHRELAGEAHDPEAARAEHRAIGVRHHEEHKAKAAAAEAQRAHEERVAEDNDLAAAAELDKAKVLTPLPKEVAAAEKSIAAVEAAKAEIPKLDTTAAPVVAALVEVNSLRDEDWGVGHGLGGVMDADDFASTHSEITGTDLEVPEQTRSDFDPFDGVPDSGYGSDHDERIAEELAGNEKPGLPAPKRDDYPDGPDYDEEFADAVAEYPKEAKAYDERRDAVVAAVEARKAQYAAAAERARTALQAHLAKQQEVLDKLTKVSEKHADKVDAAQSALADLAESSGVNEKHFAGFERNEDDDTFFADENVQDKYDEASRLGDRRLEILSNRLDDGGWSDNEVGAIEGSIDEIKQSIKALDKILKPKKTRTKKANRPDAAGAANVVGMARYKLKLSKLDFISLVDKPAQETASIRLIKRSGGDQVKASATARVVKIGEGKNPLVYCWAFTCTGEDGQPYHDLQGDAVDHDFIKAAEEFMTAGAAVDEMHDSKRTSKVAFAFPMDSDIAAGMFGKSVGGQVKTSGLMVAIRPSVEALAKLRSGAYTGVSIAGLGSREALVKRAPVNGKVAKGGVVMTSVEAGHQHTIDTATSGWQGEGMLTSGQTSSQTSEGADEAHTHAWVRDPATGGIRIAMDSGHTHEVETADEDMGDEGVFEMVDDGDENNDSPPDEETNSVKSMSDLILFKRALDLSDEHRAYLAQLEPEEAAELLTKGDVAEEFRKADAEDPIVFTSAAGEVFRKSDDARMVTLAKRNDQLAKDADIQKAAREQVELEKRAGVELVGFAKAANVKVAVVKAIDSIPDEAVRKEAWEMIRGARAALTMLGKSHGVNPGDVAASDDPTAKLEALAKKHADENKVPFAKAYDAVLSTPEGSALYTAMNQRAN